MDSSKSRVEGDKELFGYATDAGMMSFIAYWTISKILLMMMVRGKSMARGPRT